ARGRNDRRCIADVAGTRRAAWRAHGATAVCPCEPSNLRTPEPSNHLVPVMLAQARRTETVGEAGVRPLGNERFDWLPGARLVLDALAVRADREQPFELDDVAVELALVLGEAREPEAHDADHGEA